MKLKDLKNFDLGENATMIIIIALLVIAAICGVKL